MSKERCTTDGEPPDDGRWDGPAPKPVDPSSGQHGAYYVLSPSERAKGFLRPVRKKYLHMVCGALTRISAPVAETFASQPDYYSETFCAKCKDHYPVGKDGEFVWEGPGPTVITDPDDWEEFEKVGT